MTKIRTKAPYHALTIMRQVYPSARITGGNHHLGWYWIETIDGEPVGDIQVIYGAGGYYELAIYS